YAPHRDLHSFPTRRSSDLFKGPVPTQIVSNGEFNPPPQTQEQCRVESRIDALAGDLAPRHGLSRRQFLASSAGMAAAFLAMNDRSEEHTSELQSRGHLVCR